MIDDGCGLDTDKRLLAGKRLPRCDFEHQLAPDCSREIAKIVDGEDEGAGAGRLGAAPRSHRDGSHLGHPNSYILDDQEDHAMRQAVRSWFSGRSAAPRILLA